MWFQFQDLLSGDTKYVEVALVCDHQMVNTHSNFSLCMCNIHVGGIEECWDGEVQDDEMAQHFENLDLKQPNLASKL